MREFKRLFILCLILMTEGIRGAAYNPPASLSPMLQDDAFCATGNCSLMPFLKNPVIGVAFCNRYALADLNQADICCAMPFKGSAYGLRISSDGNNILTNRRLGLCFAHAPNSHFSFGLATDYQYTGIQNYGHASSISLEITLTAHVSDKLSMAFSAVNPLFRQIRRIEHEPVLRAFRFGLLYKVNPKVKLFLDIEKARTYQVNFKPICRYQFQQDFYIQAGFSSHQANCNLGFGYTKKQYRIAFNTLFGQAPGLSHSLSVFYVITR